MTWLESSGVDPRALAVVDGRGRFAAHGPHYSRRTPGSKFFTGCGKDLVLVTDCGRAVWAVVYQRAPAPRSSGASRGRSGTTAPRPWLWRNNMFRNLGAGLSSDLIREALVATYTLWLKKYGSLPPERLRTEVSVRDVKSTNPGYCYLQAGFEKGEVRKGKLYLYAPRQRQLLYDVTVKPPTREQLDRFARQISLALDEPPRRRAP